MTHRHPIDVDGYIERITSGPCFICEMVAGNPDCRHHVVYEDETAVVFLNKYPVLYGYTLVAPREHREGVTSDFTREEYLALQGLVYRVSEALRQVVPTERMYILSLGSQQGNSHVHWHLAPLPPGVPLERQQYEALRMENGILDLSEEGMAWLAARVRERLLGQGADSDRAPGIQSGGHPPGRKGGLPGAAAPGFEEVPDEQSHQR